MEGTPVDAPLHATHKEGISPTCQDDTLRVTTLIEMGGGGLTDSLSRTLVEDTHPMSWMWGHINAFTVYS